MTTQPFFTIVIPTRGRPKFLRDALVSALRQNFDDFEVVVSDNYNDHFTKDVLSDFEGENHFRSIRTDRLLNMPEHWDFATRHARGQYVLVLTDRSVLKQGALKGIYDAIAASDKEVEVCSWRWSLYCDSKGLEFGDGSTFRDKQTNTFSSRELAQEFVNGLGGYAYCLPRGLNSCYKNTLMQRIRDKFGSPFKPLSPDFYSAFVILGTTKTVLHIDKSLVIFQGQADSQGGRSISGIDTGYLESLGKLDFYSHVPIKLPLVKSLIFQDFLVASEVIGGNLKDVRFNWSAYFEKCYYELLIKRETGVLSSDKMEELFVEWKRALSTFSQQIQDNVNKKAKIMIESFRLPTHLKHLQENTTNPFMGSCKKIILKTTNTLRSRTYLFNKERKKFQTVLEVAGF